MKNMQLRFPRLLAITVAAWVLCCAFPASHRDSPAAGVAFAQAPASSVEMEQVLFVQALKDNKGMHGIHVVWIPQPIQKVCLGKTAQQCASIDYCLRTTNPDAPMCKNLGVKLASLPRYPPGMVPRRQLSISFFGIAPIKGFALLDKLCQTGPAASLERLSMSARIKARIRFTRKADDDDFDLLEVLAVPPF